jgi:gliding motility-associated-like protein
MTVVIHEYPVISALNDTICFGQSTSIIPTVDLAGGTYTWSPFTSAAPNITVSPTTTTTYQVVYSLFGCNDTALTEIYVKPVSIPQVANQTICNGQNATLTASAGIAGGDYIWSNGQTTTSIIVNPSTTTNYSVQYDLDGCLSSSVNSTVTVNPVPTLGVNNATICAGDIATLSAIVNLPSGTFTWGNPPVAGGSSLSITPLNNTSITVNYTLNGCNSLPATSAITVKPLPIATFTSNVTEGCVPLSVTFTADDPTNTDYIWTTSNSLNGNGSNATINFQSSGDFNVSLTTNLNGCIVTQTANNYIQVDNYPIASFSSSVLVFSEQNQFVQFENNSIGAASYSWSFGDGQVSTLENPDHIFLSTDQGATILLTAISLHGCTDTVSFDIPFDPGLIYYIPNSFTPDGDMFNQTFNPIFSSGADPYNFTMNIYNRWGEVIFETHDISIGWDGSYGMGTKCEPGTYTYEIIMKFPNIDERKRIHGSVNLIR